MRTALAHGCEPGVLTDWLWPGARTWTTDVDRGLGEAQRKTLAAASGADADAIARASLAPLATRIAGATPPHHGPWPWILTLGARGAKRSGGSQLCPACLADDGTPYYRIHWRLAWHTACEHHDVGLHDRCPACAKPLAPHRLGPEAGNLARCATCGFDLRAAPAKPYLKDALALQRSADAVAATGHGEFLGTETTTGVWLESTSFLARLVRRAARSPTRGLERLLDAAGCSDMRPAIQRPGTSIERLGVDERAMILKAAQHLIGLGADGLRRAVEAAGLTRQAWCERRCTVPEPLARIATALPESVSAGPKRRADQQRSGPRPRHEVRQMMARLERVAGLAPG